MENIRKLRKLNGITMKNLGKIIGCAESTVSMYESGRHEPDIKTLINLADFFNVTIDYIVGRSPETENQMNALTINEGKLLQAFRKLSVGEQRAIFRFAGIDYDNNGDSKISQTREG